MMRGELLVAVVDGQGGGMGRGLVEAVKKKWPSLHVRALGTNSLATAAMLRAGADDGATGENAVAFNARRADILLGPIGVLTPNGLLGEVSPRMAEAIGGSEAVKILLPSQRCSIRLAVGNPSRSNSIWTRQCACWARSCKSGAPADARRGGPPQF